MTDSHVFLICGNCVAFRLSVSCDSKGTQWHKRQTQKTQFVIVQILIKSGMKEKRSFKMMSTYSDWNLIQATKVKTRTPKAAATDAATGQRFTFLLPVAEAASGRIKRKWSCLSYRDTISIYISQLKMSEEWSGEEETSEASYLGGWS